MKGRIIGREGRNIRTPRAPDRASTLIVDDTPQAVVLVVRPDPPRDREASRCSKLIEDGRIQPARIEEMYYQSKAEIEEHHPSRPASRRSSRPTAASSTRRSSSCSAVSTTGRATGRTSSSTPSRSCTWPAMMATELDANVQDGEARRDPARHRQGGHARDRGLPRGDLDPVRDALRRVAGRDPRRRGAPLRGAAADGRGRAADRSATRSRRRAPERAETASRTTSSGSRRSRSSPSKRNGVEKVYALQAGREIRRHRQARARSTTTRPRCLSHEIAREIEHELEYPGQIKVTVIRESRATEFAK